VVKPKTKKVVF